VLSSKAFERNIGRLVTISAVKLRNNTSNRQVLVQSSVKSVPDHTVADVRPKDGVSITRTCFVTQRIWHFSRPIGEISLNTDLFTREEDDA
jgi:hypothetical protein